MHRVVMAAIKHESHTFNRFPTGLDIFRRQAFRRDTEVPAAFRGTGFEMSGFLDAADEYGWDAPTPVAAHANSGGRITREAFDALVEPLLAALRAKPCNGVLLALHGAMAAEHQDDGDGAILSLVREIVGPGVPIAVTLDPHANVTDQMAALANILVSYRTNPHVDHYATARLAAELLQRSMTSGVRPVTVVARAPTLVGFDRARTHTGHGPMIDALAAARDIERTTPGVLSISINAGFSHADTLETGPSVTVSGETDLFHLQAIADRLMAEGFRRRAEETIQLATVEEAVAAAVQGSPSGPVVIADYTDAPGGGAYGDATVLLRALLDAGLSNAAFGAIWDPPAAKRALEAGVGARLPLKIGGWTDRTFAGEPIEEEVEVIVLSDGRYVHKGPYAPGTIGSFGPSVLVRLRGIDVIVSTDNRNILDQEQFRIFGVEPRERSVIGLKCMHGFRADFEPMAGAVVACDAGGLSTYDYHKLGFGRIRRPIWPLDEV